MIVLKVVMLLLLPWMVIPCHKGQYFYNRMIKVSYAFKKESKGEKHGDAAERLLAANRPLVTRPGFFGQSEGSNTISHRSLLLPPSLLSAHYSHLLSNEQPAKRAVGNQFII